MKEVVLRYIGNKYGKGIIHCYNVDVYKVQVRILYNMRELF